MRFRVATVVAAALALAGCGATDAREDGVVATVRAAATLPFTVGPERDVREASVGLRWHEPASFAVSGNLVVFSERVQYTPAEERAEIFATLRDQFGGATLVAENTAPDAKVAVGSDGSRFLIAWSDAPRGVLVRRWSTTGTAIDAAPVTLQHPQTAQAPDGVEFAQTAVRIASVGGKLLVLWEDGSGSLRGALLNGANTTLTPTYLGFASLDGIPSEGRVDIPSLAASGSGYLMAWTDDRNFPTLGRDIYAARLAADGSLIDSTGFAVASRAYNQSAPAVASNGTDFFIAYEEAKPPFDEHTGDIWGTRVTAAATVQDPGGIEISASPWAEHAPSVAIDGSYQVVFDIEATGYSVPLHGATSVVVGTNGVRGAVTSLGPVEPTPLQPLAGDGQPLWRGRRIFSPAPTANLVPWEIPPVGLIDSFSAGFYSRLTWGSALEDEPGAAASNSEFLAAQSGNDGSFYTTRFDLAGNVKSTFGTQTHPISANYRVRPRVASDGTQFLLAWNTAFASPQNGSVTVRYAPADSIDAPQSEFPNFPTHVSRTGGETPLAVVGYPSGYLFTWAELDASTSSDAIYGMRLASNLTAVGEPFRITPAGFPASFVDTLGAARSGNEILVSFFARPAYSTAPGSIYGVRIGTDGAMKDAAPVTLSTDRDDVTIDAALDHFVAASPNEYAVTWTTAPATLTVARFPARQAIAPARYRLPNMAPVTHPAIAAKGNDFVVLTVDDQGPSRRLYGAALREGATSLERFTAVTLPPPRTVLRNGNRSVVAMASGPSSALVVYPRYTAKGRTYEATARVITTATSGGIPTEDAGWPLPGTGGSGGAAGGPDASTGGAAMIDASTSLPDAATDGATSSGGSSPVDGAMPPDGSASGGLSSSGGSSSGGSAASGGVPATGGSTHDASTSDAGTKPPHGGDGGCSCSLENTHRTPTTLASLSIVALALLAWRRSSRRAALVGLALFASSACGSSRDPMQGTRGNTGSRKLAVITASDIGPEITVNSAVPGPAWPTPTFPLKVTSTGSQALVVWQESRYVGSGNGNAIVATRLDDTGAALDTASLLVHRIIDRNESWQVGASGNGYLFARRDDRTLYVIRMDDGGHLLDAEPQQFVNPDASTTTVSPYDRYAVSVAGANGQFQVWWRDGLGRLRGAVFANAMTSLSPTYSSAPFTEDGSPVTLGSNGTNYLLTWADATPTPSRIYAARVGANGALLDAAPFLVGTGVGKISPGPAVGSNGTDYLVVYGAPGDFVSDILAARVTASGTVSPSAIPITSGRHVLAFPTVARHGTGYVVEWLEKKDPPGFYGDARMTRVSAAGTVLDPEDIVIEPATDEGSPLTAVTSVNATAIAVWQRPQPSSGEKWRQLQSARLLGEPPALEPERRISGNDVVEERHVAAASRSGFLIVCHDADRLYAVRLDLAGNVLDPAGIMLASGLEQPPEPRTLPRVASDGTDYFVAWVDAGAMHGTRVTRGGSVSDPGGRVLIPNPTRVALGELALSGSGAGYLLDWTESDSAGTRSVVQGARLLANGDVDGAPFTVANSGGISKAFLWSASSGSEALVAWLESDSVPTTTARVYGVRVGRDGEVHDATPVPLSDAATTAHLDVPATGLVGATSTGYAVAYRVDSRLEVARLPSGTSRVVERFTLRDAPLYSHPYAANHGDDHVVLLMDDVQAYRSVQALTLAPGSTDLAPYPLSTLPAAPTPILDGFRPRLAAAAGPTSMLVVYPRYDAGTRTYRRTARLILGGTPVPGSPDGGTRDGGTRDGGDGVDGGGVVVATGGATASGGATTSDGSVVASGGTTSSGGAAGSGGAVGSGANRSSGGSESVDAGTGSSHDDNGCDCALRGSSPAPARPFVLAALALIVLRRRSRKANPWKQRAPTE